MNPMQGGGGGVSQGIQNLPGVQGTQDLMQRANALRAGVAGIQRPQVNLPITPQTPGPQQVQTPDWARDSEILTNQPQTRPMGNRNTGVINPANNINRPIRSSDNAIMLTGPAREADMNASHELAQRLRNAPKPLGQAGLPQQGY